MPVIKVKHVVSFSSEDKVHKAENLLRPETYRKWKCATPGEKEASVVLQFEKAEQIHSIDIGNEGSAFVEVLVKRSSDRNPAYEVLLGASSFMTPLESRNESHCNRVRMLDTDKLTQTIIYEKWDLVKIVCTQPFNKNIQYGLTFITFHSPPEISINNTPTPIPRKSLSKLGAFEVKEEDDEDEDILTGSWFAKRKEKQEPDPVSGPAAIRQASSLAANVLALTPKASPVMKPETKPKLIQPKQESNTSSTLQQKDTKEISKWSGESSSVSNSFERKKRDQFAVSKGEDSSQPPPKKPKKKEKIPFSRIMEKVTLVLSGFQNPLRSELREKALDMGAKYKADWDRSCTHLICAFMNTPKYNQVKSSGGRIVSKKWIEDCYKKSRLLPWRKFLLGDYLEETESESTPESESEEDYSTKKSVDKKKNKESSIQKPNIPQIKPSNKAIFTSEVNRSQIEISPKKIKEERDNSDVSHLEDKKEQRSSDEEYEAPTDVDSEDTEDELRKAHEQNALENGSLGKPDTSAISLPELPNFFKGKHFFFYGNFSSEERHNLKRYIVAYNGTLEEYMSETVRFVVTNSKWDKNFDEALTENDNLIFVRPQWIFKCNEQEKLVPFQPFVVSA